MGLPPKAGGFGKFSDQPGNNFGGMDHPTPFTDWLTNGLVINKNSLRWYSSRHSSTSSAYPFVPSFPETIRSFSRAALWSCRRWKRYISKVPVTDYGLALKALETRSLSMWSLMALIPLMCPAINRKGKGPRGVVHKSIQEKYAYLKVPAWRDSRLLPEASEPTGPEWTRTAC